MHKLASGVFVENKYPGVSLGTIVTKNGLMLIDSPVYVDDGRSWLEELRELGKPRFLTLLDTHPDRVLGARGLNLRLVAHGWTRSVISSWSDSFKGGANPIGAEADGLKRITGVRKAIPELSFSDEMLLHLGKRKIYFWHRPGPTPGSVWTVLHDKKIIFIGDAVMITEPPFLGHADIGAWHETLDDLRSSELQSYTLVSSHDGVIKREHIHAMARFLRRVQNRITKLSERGEPQKNVTKYASQLMKGYEIPPARKDLVRLRLQVGLMRLYSRLYTSES